MKLRVLGSNGWFPTDGGSTVCLLVETDDCYVVLDAGDGIHKLDKYITASKPIYLFLSHFHLDHVWGLHILPKFSLVQGITIYGQPGSEDTLRTFINHPFAVPPEELQKMFSLEVKVHDLPEGKSSPPAVPFSIETAFLVHWDPCFGYRMSLEGKVIAYCTDTGYCDNLVKLARGADLFITECSLKTGEEPSEEWPHLNPELAARAAREAGARKMLLTHFGPQVYRNLKDRQEAEGAAKEVFAPTVAGYDGLELEI